MSMQDQEPVEQQEADHDAYHEGYSDGFDHGYRTAVAFIDNVNMYWEYVRANPTADGLAAMRCQMRHVADYLRTMRDA